MAVYQQPTAERLLSTLPAQVRAPISIPNADEQL